MTDKRSEKAGDETQTKRFPIRLAFVTVFLTWPIAFTATLLAIFFAGASFREIDNAAGLFLVLCNWCGRWNYSDAVHTSYDLVADWHSCW